MTDKVQKIREEIERLKSQLLRGACSSQIAMETRCKEEAYNEILAILDTMQKEPVCAFSTNRYTDEARKAVEIAREEMIEKFYDWLRNNATYIHPRKGTEECITTLVKLKEAMKDE